MFKSAFALASIAYCSLFAAQAFARVSTLDCQKGDFHLTIAKNLDEVSNGTIGLARLELSFHGNLSVAGLEGAADIENVVKADPGANDYNIQGDNGCSLSSRYQSSYFALHDVFITSQGQALNLDGYLSGYIDGAINTMNVSISGAATETLEGVSCTYQIHD